MSVDPSQLPADSLLAWTCVRLVRERLRPSVTLAWLLGMLSIPYLDVPLYVLFGSRKLRGLRSVVGRREPSRKHGIEALLEHDTVAFERREARFLERALADLTSLAAPLL